MDKKVKVMSGIATAVIGAGIATTSVNADEVIENKISTPSTEVKVEAPVTAESVATSGDNLNQATLAVKEQTAIVNNVQADMNVATENVTVAKATVNRSEQLVADASPATIEKAEQATVVSNAKAEVATAETIQVEKATAVKAQESVVAEKEDSVKIAEVATHNAKASVNSAQAVLDGTGQTEIVAKAEKAEIALAEAETNVSIAEGKLAQAKESDKTAQMQLSLAETSVRNDLVAVNNTKATLDQAMSKVAESDKIVKAKAESVKKAQTTVDGLASEIANHNTITVPAGYAEALRQFDRSKVSERDDTKLTEIGKKALALNTYKSNQKDKDTVVGDVSNLTQEQREDIANFATDLLNQIRKAMGTQAVVANKSAIAFAKEVANTSAKTGVESLNHDTVAISEGAQKFGLAVVETGNGYENLSVGYYQVSPQLTIDELKKAIYRTIVDMMYKDGDSLWGHSTSLAGIRSEFKNDPNYQIDSKYIGIGFSTNQYMGLTSGRIHILGVAESRVKDASIFDKTANLAKRDLQAELAEAKSNLSVEQVEYDQAVAVNKDAELVKTNAQFDYNKAVQELERSQANLAELQDRTEQTPKALANYKNALTNYDLANNNNELAQQALKSLNADVQTKQQALEKAKANLVVKQNQLALAKEGLIKEQVILKNLVSALREAEANVKVKQTTLAQAEAKVIELVQYVEDLKNAPKVLADAQAKLVEAEKALAEKVNILETEQAKLKTLEAVQKDVSVKHAKIVEAYKVIVKAQEEARKLSEEKKKLEVDKRTKEETLQNMATVQQMSNEVMAKRASKPQLLYGMNPVAKDDTSTEKASFTLNKGQELPETGDTNNNAVLVGLGSVMALLGLAGIRKKGQK